MKEKLTTPKVTFTRDQSKWHSNNEAFDYGWKIVRKSVQMYASLLSKKCPIYWLLIYFQETKNFIEPSVLFNINCTKKTLIFHNGSSAFYSMKVSIGPISIIECGQQQKNTFNYCYQIPYMKGIRRFTQWTKKLKESSSYICWKIVWHVWGDAFFKFLSDAEYLAFDFEMPIFIVDWVKKAL